VITIKGRTICAGMEAFGAQWKTKEPKIVEGPALPNAIPVPH
jgi:hypothetical protein